MAVVLAPRQRSAKLASVKHEIYHPQLPTFRKMDRDDVMHKLPYEHSRTTTPCSRADFMKPRTSLITGGGPLLSCKKVLNEDILKLMAKYKPVEKVETSYTENWNKIISRMSDHETRAGGSGISGLCDRKKHPDITSSWHHYFRPETTVSSLSNTTKPLPALIYARHRNAPRQGRREAWK